MFTGSFNVLSFSVTSKISLMLEQKRCVLLIIKLQLINIFYQRNNLQKSTLKSIARDFHIAFCRCTKLQNERIEYFRKDANLEELFIDYDNILEERRTMAKSDLLTKR